MKRDLLELADFDDLRPVKRFYQDLLGRIAPIDLVGLLAAEGLTGEKTGDRLKLHCPFHGGWESLTLNLTIEGPQKGLFYCFSPRCLTGGFVTKLLKEVTGRSHEAILQLLGVSFAPALADDTEDLVARVEAACDLRGAKFPDYSDRDWLSDEQKSVGQLIETVERVVPLPFRDDFAESRELRHLTAQGYLTKIRQFDSQSAFSLINRLSITVCYPAENRRWGGRVIVPVRTFDQSWTFYLGRATMSRQNPKVLYPAGVPISRLFLGEESLSIPFAGENSTLYLVEGPLDWLRLTSFGLPALACFSAHLSNVQIARLLRLQKHFLFERVCIAFDGDLAGWMGGTEALRDLTPFLPTEMLRLPNDTDPCDCTNKDTFLNFPRVSAHSLSIPEKVIDI